MLKRLRLAYFCNTIKMPKECYYKILNLSISSSPDEIKKEYFNLVKKYHPDSSNNEQVEKFKQISEAYEILSNQVKRDAYNSLILGSSNSNFNYSVNFKNNENYKHFSEMSPNQQKINKFKEQMKAGVPLDEITKAYTERKSLDKEDLTPGQKVWKDLKYDYNLDYRTDDKFSLNKSFKNEYNMHNDEETINQFQYFETKESDEYYSKSRKERVKLKIKEMVRLYRHYSFFIIFSFICTIYNAYINTSTYYLDFSS